MLDHIAISRYDCDPLLFSIAMTVAIVIHFTIQVFGSLRLQAVNEKIGGTVKSRPDLDQVRGAIQLNLFLGVPLICNGVFMVALILWFSSLKAVLACLAILAVGQAVLWVVCRPIEKRFKLLAVAPGHEDLAEEYRSYVKQWSGCNILLKAPHTVSKV
jgi:phosphatidylserine synthase